MTEFAVSVDIQAPPSTVWQVLLDVERWPQWTSTVNSVQRLDQGPLTSGSRAQISQPKLRSAMWQVTEVDEIRKIFAWTTRSLGVRVTGRHQVKDVDNGSRVRLSLEFSGFLGPLMARVFRGLNLRYLDTEAKGLKDRCES